MSGSFDKIVVPQRCLHSNLGTYKYVTLYDKGDFADVIKIEDLPKARLSWNFQLGSIWSHEFLKLGQGIQD